MVVEDRIELSASPLSGECSSAELLNLMEVPIGFEPMNGSFAAAALDQT